MAQLLGAVKDSCNVLGAFDKLRLVKTFRTRFGDSKCTSIHRSLREVLNPIEKQRPNLWIH